MFTTNSTKTLVFGAGSAMATALLRAKIRECSDRIIWAVSSSILLSESLTDKSDHIKGLNILLANWDDWESLAANLNRCLLGIDFDEVYIFCGIQGNSSSGGYGSLCDTNAQAVFRSNVFIPSKILEFLVYNLEQTKANIYIISSRAGSISERGRLAHHAPGGNAIYRASKAALNMMVKCFAYDNPTGPNVFLIHPGFVRSNTNIAENAKPVEEFVWHMRLLENSTQEFQTGAFIDLPSKSLISP